MSLEPLYPNPKATKTWEQDGRMYAEWSSHALDDPKRYEEYDVILTVSVPLIEGDELGVNLANALNDAFDQWVRETRV